jgi:hypothetical protein
MPSKPNAKFPRIIVQYCRQRLASALPPRETARLESYLLTCFSAGKQTGSYEQASYAIQDTPEVVAMHYGRFLPQDKVALAAQVLNKVWEAA